MNELTGGFRVAQLTPEIETAKWKWTGRGVDVSVRPPADPRNALKCFVTRLEARQCQKVAHWKAQSRSSPAVQDRVWRLKTRRSTSAVRVSRYQLVGLRFASASANIVGPAVRRNSTFTANSCLVLLWKDIATRGTHTSHERCERQNAMVGAESKRTSNFPWLIDTGSCRSISFEL